MERFNRPALVQRSGNDSVYGSGIDGNVTVLSGTSTTITSDMYYNDLTIQSSATLFTNGFRVFVKGILTLNGHIGIGSVSSGVVGESASNISDGTVKGQTSGVITYRAGGQGGGSTNPDIPALPSFLYKDINVMSGGVFTDPVSGTIAIGGGSAGTTGSNGASTPALTTWPGKAGSAGADGSYAPNATTVGASGGKGGTGTDGTAGTPGPGGVGGSGGLGGGVVCLVARTIVGTGKVISVGKSGTAGTAGTAGSAGTTGTAGSPAPSLSVHNPPTSVHNPPVHNPSHHHHYTNHSDRHGHASRQHVQQHAQEHVGDSKHGAHHTTPHHHGTGHHHATPHHHHNGHFHHPHNDGPHGGTHHWNPHWWHAYFQLSHGHPFPHYHAKPNGHGGHSHSVTQGGHDTRRYHAKFVGHDNHWAPDSTHEYQLHPNAHSPHSGGHSHAPVRHDAWSHHPVAPHTHPNPNTVYPGGAGGAGGVGAPAVTGQSGKRGGSGGGGAILVVSDSVAGTITYDTRAGLLADSDNHGASQGAAYILINA